MRIWEDYYRILQVHYNAEQEVVEGAYRRLCKKYHPDINRSAASEDKIKQINNAYETLKNPDTRKAYHKKWLDRNKAVHKQEVNEKPQWQKGFDAVIDKEAQEAVNQYIKYLSDKKYTKAYNMLLTRNKRQVNVEDFIEWQKNVSKIYGIGFFETRVFNTYDNVKLNDQFYKKVIEFEVKMSEKNLKTGRVYQYKFTKMVGLENNRWGIYLEYEDIKTLIHKFEYLYHSGRKKTAAQGYAEYQMLKDEITGLKSKKGFLEELEREKNRFLRYMNTFCVAVFAMDSEKDLSEEYYRYIAYTINQCIRNTDVIAHIDQGVFSVLYTETSYAQAQIAARNVYNTLIENLKKYHKKDINFKCGVYEHTGRNVVETFNIACSLAEIELEHDSDDYTGMGFGSANES